MKNIFIILISFFTLHEAYSLEVACKFEEVYADKTVQNGFFLFSNSNLRYEYDNANLYKIFYDGKNLVIAENSDPKKQKKINNNKIIDILFSLSQKYPNIDNVINIEGVLINLEKQISGNFYKRISIKSDQINLSIYLNECKFIKISEIFFQLKPIVKFYF